MSPRRAALRNLSAILCLCLGCSSGADQEATELRKEEKQSAAQVAAKVEKLTNLQAQISAARDANDAQSAAIEAKLVTATDAFEIAEFKAELVKLEAEATDIAELADVADEVAVAWGD